MERNEIIKALECCIEGECGDCSYDEQTACKEYLLHDALALIKKLTIELDAMRGAANSYKMHNERLTEENERLKSISINKDITIEAINEVIKQLNEENERLKSEVSVKKKLLDKCVDLEDRVRADTVREFAERLKKDCLVDSGYEVLQIGTIDRIAEEMLGKECTDCKHFVGCECFDGKVCDLYEKK